VTGAPGGSRGDEDGETASTLQADNPGAPSALTRAVHKPQCQIRVRVSTALLALATPGWILDAGLARVKIPDGPGQLHDILAWDVLDLPGELIAVTFLILVPSIGIYFFRQQREAILQCILELTLCVVMVILLPVY
jgi:hypothetical protein